MRHEARLIVETIDHGARLGVAIEFERDGQHVRYGVSAPLGSPDAAIDAVVTLARKNGFAE